MVKKKTPEHLKRARESLRKFHAPESIAKDDHIEPWPWSEGELPPTVVTWSRTHSLLAGLESVIPKDRFNAINDALLSVDQLTIMVENLKETSRQDVLTSAARGVGGAKGGRGHKADGTGNQATDKDILLVYTTLKENGARKSQKRLVIDTMLHLTQQGKTASDTKIRNVVVAHNKHKKSVAEP